MEQQSLYERIRDDQITARKNKDTTRAKLLTTLLGEAGSSGNQSAPSDKKVESAIKKLIKGLEEILEVKRKHNVKVIDAGEPDKAKDITQEEQELIILQSYLPEPPKQLTEDELAGVIFDIITELDIDDKKSMGRVMKTLKERHPGQYDGSVASEIVKQRLS